MSRKPKRTMAEIRQAKAERIANEKREKYYANKYIMPPECDILCRFRRCYNKHENKGSFTTGRGYSRYYKDFRPACGTRLTFGCPDSRGKHDSSDYSMLEVLRFIENTIDESLKTHPKKTGEERRALEKDMVVVSKIIWEWRKHEEGKSINPCCN